MLDSKLFTTLTFDEKGFSLYQSGFDTPKRKVSEIFAQEALTRLSKIDSVRVNKVFDEEVRNALKGKTIETLSISGGIAGENIHGLSGIRKIGLLNIQSQEIPAMFQFPSNISVFWAPNADLSSGLASPINARIVNIAGAKFPNGFYINDTCKELRINANDLDKVIIPPKITKIAFVGGEIPQSFDLQKYPGLKEICFNNGVKLPKILYIPDNVKIDIGNSVDVSQAEAVDINYTTLLKSPNISTFLTQDKNLFIRKMQEEEAFFIESIKGKGNHR